MLGFVDGHAVDVVDALADRVALEGVQRAGQRAIEVPRPQAGRHHQPLGRDVVRQRRDHRLRRRARRIALVDHHPAHEVEQMAAVVLRRVGAHPDVAGLAAGVLLEPDHLRGREQRVAGIEQRAEAAVGIAEIGDRVGETSGTLRPNAR